jgi:hypothetical protein
MEGHIHAMERAVYLTVHSPDLSCCPTSGVHFSSLQSLMLMLREALISVQSLSNHRGPLLCGFDQNARSVNRAQKWHISALEISQRKTRPSVLLRTGPRAVAFQCSLIINGYWG